MPKSSMRRSPHKSCLHHAAAAYSGSLLLSTPRKVSFEEASCSGSELDTSEHSHGSVVAQEQRHSVANPLTRKRSLLARPKSSMSLVDLANQAMNEDQAAGESSSSFVEEAQDGEPKAKRMCSPRTALKVTEEPPKPSPWGQFVDMLVPEDEERSSNSPHLCYLDTVCSNMCCRENSSRARRSSPYGDYKSRTRRALPPPSHLHLQQDTFTTSNESKFRLTPRKEAASSADQLIGPFSGLNF